MILDFVFFFIGVLVGMNLRQENLLKKYNKTVEQLDQELRNDLEYYRNLSESLQEDLRIAKQKSLK
jgi:hypothetical protein